MFNKLVSNLPFNPSLIAQVGFYTQRLKKESSIRRLGFLFIVAAMLVQMFAVIAPPEKSLAASSNHIINGLQTRTDIENAWNANGSDIPAIYGKFGLELSDIQALPMKPNVTIVSTSADWWTIGRNSLSGYSNVAQKYKNSELPIQYSGTNTEEKTDDKFVYMRSLRAWDIKNPSNSYAAFKGTIKKTGETFWILKDCGNFTKVGKPSPKKPAIEIKKTIEGSPSSLKPGETMTYRIEYRNSVPESVAENVVIKDELDLEHFDIVSPTGLPITGRTLNYPVGNLAYKENGAYSVLSITVRLKNPIASGTKICNASSISASNASTATSGNACVHVINTCIYEPTKPEGPECVEPKVVCKVVDSAINYTKKEVTFKTTASTTNAAVTVIKEYKYDFDGDGKYDQTIASTELMNSTSHVYAPGEYTAKVAVVYSLNAGAKKNVSQETTCETPIKFEKDSVLGQAKTVKNITKNLSESQSAQAKVNAGDVLEYKLITTNSQNYDRENILISDYIGDILDYASLDQEFLKAQGGIYNEKDKKVEWSKVTLPASKNVEKIFRVTLKNPIPATNQPSTVSTDFDCKISNKYGDEITIDVQCPLVKGVETIYKTGPGENLLFGFVVTSIIGYFFARSRLLAKELDIIRGDFAMNGGN